MKNMARESHQDHNIFESVPKACFKASDGGGVSRSDVGGGNFALTRCRGFGGNFASNQLFHTSSFPTVYRHGNW